MTVHPKNGEKHFMGPVALGRALMQLNHMAGATMREVKRRQHHENPRHKAKRKRKEGDADRKGRMARKQRETF